jgi:hypothetical protein
MLCASLYLCIWLYLVFNLVLFEAPRILRENICIHELAHLGTSAGDSVNVSYISHRSYAAETRSASARNPTLPSFETEMILE